MMQIFDMPKYGATDKNGNMTKKVLVEERREGEGEGRLNCIVQNIKKNYLQN